MHSSAAPGLRLARLSGQLPGAWACSCTPRQPRRASHATKTHDNIQLGGVRADWSALPAVCTMLVRSFAKRPSVLSTRTAPACLPSLCCSVPWPPPISALQGTPPTSHITQQVWDIVILILVRSRLFCLVSRPLLYNTRSCHTSCLPSISWDMQTENSNAMLVNEVETQTPTLSMINQIQPALTCSTLKLMPRPSRFASSSQDSSSSTSSHSFLVYPHDSRCQSLVVGCHSCWRTSTRF